MAVMADLIDADDPPAQPVEPPARTTAYGPEAGQVYDVRRPAGAARGVTLVVIHGGFWRAQWDREHAAPEAQRLADLGFGVAVLEYRRVGMPGGGFPGTLEDVRRGLAAIAADPAFNGPIIAVGHSAGGHLAVWAASQHGMPLSGAVSLGGCVDLTMTARLHAGSGAVQEFLGGGPEDLPDVYAMADPALLRPLARVALVHGTDDEDVPITVSESYAAAMERAGTPVRLWRIERGTHDGLIEPEAPEFTTVLEAIESLAP
jgi:acetyl esterase/lipase